MVEKAQKVRRIHRVLIVLIIILSVALFLELKHEKGEWLPKEMGAKPEEYRRYVIVPSVEKGIGAFQPEIDLAETESEYIVRCDLPGVDKDQIEVSVRGNCLTISGRRDIKRGEVKEGPYYYQERTWGKFQRSILLPGLVNEEGVEAEYKDGILMIRLPKREPIKEWEPKKIHII